ncbi:MAG: LPXTG cell wall anchor domain-containing protein [Actinomycetota bacterium]
MAAAIGVLLLVGFAPSALGHDRSFSTSVTFNYDGVNFYGRVSSPSQGCVAGRTVVLYRQGAVVGSDTTDAEGNYVIPQPGAGGADYHVVVRASTNSSYGHRHVCNAAQSRTLGEDVLGAGEGQDGEGEVAGAGVGVGELPDTGGNGVPFAAVGGGLLLLGAGLLVVALRRRPTQSDRPLT